MTGGLLELVAKGSQDIFLTGNPSVTFFRSVYKKHTNFSMESVQQTFEGTYDFGQNLSCTISRSGDLLYGVVIEIDLPKINGLLTGTTIPWIDSIGHFIINEVYIEIGGQIIDKQYGEWMEIWNELTLNEEHKDGYNTMIGRNITINEEKTLIIPLQFWFCKNIGLALPLIALQYHEVKIHIKLNDFDKLWKKEIFKFNATRATNGLVTLSSSSENFSDIDESTERYTGMSVIWSDTMEENIIQSVDVSTNPDQLQLVGTHTAKTATDLYIIKNIPDKTYTLNDIRIYCDYIYLDTAERKHFAQIKQEILIEQVQYNGVDDYTKGTEALKVTLDFNHPCKELIWINQINNTEKFNQLNNFSDRIDAGANDLDNSIKKAILHLNGTERFGERTADYFRLLIPYQRHTRTPGKHIYVYSFSLNPEQNQPSGTCNFSRIDNSELHLSLKSTLSSSRVRVYATNYNILRIINGMGGLAYSN